MSARTRGVQRRRPSVERTLLQRRIGPVPLWAIGGLLVAVVGVVAIAVLNTFTGAEVPSAGSAEYAVGDPGPGQPAPDFSLASTTGEVFQLSSQRGQTVLLYFHEGLMCAPCWQQVVDIQRDFAEFQALGIDQIVPISNDPLASQAQHAQQNGVTFPALADEDKAVSSQYDALAYGMMGGQSPGHTFILVDADGRIVWRADYGGEPDYTMYVPNETILAELRQVIGSDRS